MLAKLCNVRVNELAPSAARRIQNLAGRWAFALDPEKTGEKNGWWRPEHMLGDTITVPGCLEAEGKGITHLPITRPLWSGTMDLPFLGVSWHQRRFHLEESLRHGEALMLNFGGVANLRDGQYAPEFALVG